MHKTTHPAVSSLRQSAHTYLSQAKEAAPLEKRIFLVIAVFIVHTVWYQMVSYGVVDVLPSELFSDAVPTTRFVFLVAMIGSFFVLMVFDTFVQRNNRLLLPLMTATLLLGTGMCLIAKSQTAVTAYSLATLGSGIMGISYGWIYLSAFRLLRNNARMWEVALVFISLSVISNIVIALLLALLPEAGLYASMLIAIVLNGFLLGIAQKKLQIDGVPRVTKLKHSLALTRNSLRSSKLIRNQLILLLAISMTVAIMRLMNIDISGTFGNTHVVAVWTNSPIIPLTEILVFAGLGLGLFFFCTHRKSMVWAQVPFIVMLAGLIILQFLQQDFVRTLGFVIYGTVMEWFCQLTYSFTLVAVMRSLPMSTFRTIGFASIITRSFSLIFAMIFADVNILKMAPIVLGAAYLIALLISYMAKDAPDPGTPVVAFSNEKSSEGVDSEIRSLESRIETIALEGKLTRRETEILALLIQGKNLPAICENLVISNDTAGTHIKHIYKKLDVHTRQELMSLFL